MRRLPALPHPDHLSRELRIHVNMEVPVVDPERRQNPVVLPAAELQGTQDEPPRSRLAEEMLWKAMEWRNLGPVSGSYGPTKKSGSADRSHQNSASHATRKRFWRRRTIGSTAAASRLALPGMLRRWAVTLGTSPKTSPVHRQLHPVSSSASCQRILPTDMGSRSSGSANMMRRQRASWATFRLRSSTSLCLGTVFWSTLAQCCELLGLPMAQQR